MSLAQTAGDERVRRQSQTPLIKTVNQRLQPDLFHTSEHAKVKR